MIWICRKGIKSGVYVNILVKGSFLWASSETTPERSSSILRLWHTLWQKILDPGVRRLSGMQNFVDPIPYQVRYLKRICLNAYQTFRSIDSGYLPSSVSSNEEHPVETDRQIYLPHAWLNTSTVVEWAFAALLPWAVLCVPASKLNDFRDTMAAKWCPPTPWIHLFPLQIWHGGEWGLGKGDCLYLHSSRWGIIVCCDKQGRWVVWDPRFV